MPSSGFNRVLVECRVFGNQEIEGAWNNFRVARRRDFKSQSVEIIQ
jgi:hypothetical protein